MNGLALFLALYTATEAQKLSHDEWKVREQASINLANLMPLSDQLLSQVNGDAESFARARRIREDWISQQSQWYFCRAKCFKVPGWNLIPWIDSLTQQRGNASYWLDKAHNHPEIVKIGPRIYEDYRLATVLWIEVQLRSGVSEGEILKELVEAVAYERDWLERNSHQEHWAELLRECLGAELIGGPK